MSQLIEALAELKADQVLAEVKARKSRGTAALEIIHDLQEGMRLVGQRFEAKEYYLSELIMSAEIFKQASAALDLEVKLSSGEAERGRFLIGTVFGDIHDIGKNIVATILSLNGFEVIDLGVNVTAANFVQAAREHRPSLVGLSCLLTTAFESMKETVAALKVASLRPGLPVIIGGAPVDQKTCDYVGADAFCLNAHQAVETAWRLAGGSR